MQDVDRLGWAVTVPIRGGDYTLGVRCSSELLASMVERTLADRVQQGASPPRNLSLFGSTTTPGEPRKFHRLYVTYDRVLRTTSLVRLFEGLWHAVDAWDVRAAEAALLVDAVAVVDGERAHLLPPSWRMLALNSERSLARSGLMVLDRRWLALDLDAGTITVPAPRLPEPRTWLPADVETDLLHREEPGRPSGRFVIASWASGVEDAPLGLRTALAGRQLLDLPAHGGAGTVSEVARLLASTTDIGGGWRRREELHERLRAV